VLVLLFTKQSVASCSKGKGSVSLSFSSEKYDKVYFIPEKVDGVPVLTKQVYSTSIYATYGISDQVDVVVVLPYVQAKVMQQIRF
jgi:hypothetical protein